MIIVFLVGLGWLVLAKKPAPSKLVSNVRALSGQSKWSGARAVAMQPVNQQAPLDSRFVPCTCSDGRASVRLANPGILPGGCMCDPADGGLHGLAESATTAGLDYVTGGNFTKAREELEQGNYTGAAGTANTAVTIVDGRSR